MQLGRSEEAYGAALSYPTVQTSPDFPASHRIHPVLVEWLKVREQQLPLMSFMHQHQPNA